VKTWTYQEPVLTLGDVVLGDRIVMMNEAEILDHYYSWWSTRMLEAGKILMATEENCIGDWVVVNWAEEVK